MSLSHTSGSQVFTPEHCPSHHSPSLTRHSNISGALQVSQVGLQHVLQLGLPFSHRRYRPVYKLMTLLLGHQLLIKCRLSVSFFGVLIQLRSNQPTSWSFRHYTPTPIFHVYIIEPVTAFPITRTFSQVTTGETLSAGTTCASPVSHDCVPLLGRVGDELISTPHFTVCFFGPLSVPCTLFWVL